MADIGSEHSVPIVLPTTVPYSALLRDQLDAQATFSYIDPPFNFNAPTVAAYPAEVSGYYLLKSLSRHLGWSSLNQKRLLDFGCGVRFARTIVNLGLDIAYYVGVDTQSEPIQWLRSNVDDARLRFEHFNIRNVLYNPDGDNPEADLLAGAGLTGFDAASMFSVITHQNPEEAARTFEMLYPCVKDGGALYFTAFVDESVNEYVEREPQLKGHMSTYHPSYLLDILLDAGWFVSDIYPPSAFALTAFVCWKRSHTK